MKLLSRIKILGSKKNGNFLYVPFMLFVIFLGSPLISIYSAQIDANEYLKMVSDHFISLENSFSVSDSTIPRSMKNDGSIRFVKSKDWTSGFFPGTLWQLYIFSGNKA